MSGERDTSAEALGWVAYDEYRAHLAGELGWAPGEIYDFSALRDDERAAWGRIGAAVAVHVASDQTAELARLRDENKGLRGSLQAIKLGISEPTPQGVAENALNGRYFDPMNDGGVWSFAGTLRAVPDAEPEASAEPHRDVLTKDAAKFAATRVGGFVTATMIQRLCHVGYGRAVAILDTLAEDGNVKPRDDKGRYAAPQTDPDCTVCAQVGGPHGVPQAETDR